MAVLYGRTRVFAFMAIVVFGAPFAGLVCHAQSNSTGVPVATTVIANCSISASPLAFGNYDPVVVHAASPLDAAGGVTITCTKGATTPIALDLGLNPTGSTRRMVSGGDYLTYELYQNSGRTTVWGTGGSAFTPPVAPSKAARLFTVYGRVPAGQDVRAGAYADTVTATVNF